MKKLGFGLMRLPTQEIDGEKKIDIEQLKEMVDTFLARGFTYFDTAWMYCNFQSECATREALVERHPRDTYTEATADAEVRYSSVCDYLVNWHIDQYVEEEIVEEKFDPFDESQVDLSGLGNYKTQEEPAE